MDASDKQLEIRAFGARDHDEVVALWKAVFGYPQPRNDPAYVIGLKMAVQSELFFVGRRDGQLAGTIMAGYDGHRGWMYSLAVPERLRRQGIGTALIRHAERELVARGCPKINLQVLETNGGVVAFYEMLGYRVEPRVSMGKVL